MKLLGKKQNLAVQPQTYALPEQVRHQFGRIYMLESLSPVMGQVYKKIGKVLDSQAPLLFQGETSAGKESLARVIHGAGKQHHGHFVVVPCQASEEQLRKELFGTRNGTLTAEGNWGKLGEADDGTVFLKNVEALPPTLQLQILHLLQEKIIRHPESHDTRKINLRVIASTKKNLDLEVTAGRFRQDLYFRLSVYQFDLPPLRDRKPDISKFASHFADKFAVDAGGEPLAFTAHSLSQLETHNWPGNIRELMQVVLCSMTQKRTGDRTVDQIQWASRNGHEDPPDETTHGSEPPEVGSLTIKLKKEVLEQATFP